MRFLFLLLLLASAAFVVPIRSQPLTTSDSRQTHPALPYPPGASSPWPERVRVYIAPQIDVFPVLLTNIRPLVIEITVTTQVVQRTVWHQDGRRQTNDLVLSSNLLSRITNSVNRD